MIDFYPLVRPVLFRLEPETAHAAAIAALRSGLLPGDGRPDPASLAQHLWGRTFPNPIGIAAGFDKNAEVIGPLLRLGFGFVEVGTLTPRPQAGNPRPRVFRLPDQGAMINRLGFNNRGAAAAAVRLAAFRRGRRPGIVGVNLGCNRDSVDEIADYCAGIACLGAEADYLVLNISSPNTPGLRTLQQPERLAALLAAVAKARAALCRAPPLLVKIAPDLTAADRIDLAAIVAEAGVDGLIVANTTIARPSSVPPALAGQAGGLSGRPLFEPSTRLLAEMHRLTKGRLPLIGVGGIAGPAEAYAKIRAGASLVQLYTAMVYHGPMLVGRIKAGLVDRLRQDGLSTIAEAVGRDAAALAATGPAA